MPESGPTRLAQRLEGELGALRGQSQYRTLEIPGGIDLCSNDYLGLAGDPRLKQRVAEAVGRTTKVGSTGSRLLSGNSRDWEDLEEEFAEYTGSEAALYFSSGYAANTGLLSSVTRPGDVIYSDALNHASLIDGIRLSGAAKIIYPHSDLEFLEGALREHAGGAGARLIVTESIFSMQGDVAPLPGLLRLAREYGADLIVDEAHALGVCGPQGRGLVAELGLGREVLATVYTCGKALASAGAFVCGRRALRNYLVNHARSFIFSTAMPPYFAHQIRAAVALAQEAEERRAHLREIADFLRGELAAAGLSFGASTTQIVPILLGANETALQVAAELQRNGFAVRAIRPPTVPAGTARLRLSLTSALTSEEMRRLACGLRGAMAEARPSASPLCAPAAVHG